VTTPPTFRYPGGKHYQRKWLVGMFDSEAARYVEPFAGRGSVAFLAMQSLPRIGRAWLNDPSTYMFLDLLRSMPVDGLLGLLGDAYPTRSEYETYTGQGTRHHAGLRTPRALLIEPLVTCGGGGYGQGYQQHAKGPTLEGYKRKVARAHEILNTVPCDITGTDYRRVLAGCRSGDMVYLDPPYYGRDVRPYSSMGFDVEGMYETLVDADFSWVLSEYDGEHARAVLGPPDARHETTLKVNSRSRNTRKRVECVWCSENLKSKVDSMSN